MIDSILPGMKEKKVKEIMGPPSYLLEEFESEDSIIIYVYEAPFGSSGDYRIRIRLQDNLVHSVSQYD